MKKAQKGATLIEVIVAAFVISILLTVAVQVFVPAMRAWGDGQKRSEVTQGLLVTSNWIADDIQRCSPNSLNLTDEGILVMRTSRGLGADHTNEFNEVVAYWVENGELFRGDRDEGAGANTGPPALTLTDVGALETKRRVASGVTTFEVNIVQPWRINLHMVVTRGQSPAGNEIVNDTLRSAEIRTSYSSMYAPFDPNVAEASAALED